MLRISKKADYAVFLLGAIARAGAYPGGAAGDTVVSAHEIARRAHLNKSVVANLLKEFARAGMLESTRGLRGGYRLLRQPSEISLGQILEVVEGKFVLVDCVAHDASANQLLALAPSMRSERSAAAPAGEHECSLISFCPSKAPMRVVHERISQLFASIHLDELCSLPPTPTGRATTPTSATACPR
jgi:Rrf2 family protein